ncbi:TonB-dependent receptor domain-containing protein [Oleiharenicola lentus]|uniref:TonB-dependent receptor domain-containing protein n=1 Tax=Oleiharenicola lentus TaxID=2508720 RepID=UPI003F6666E1
MQNQPHQQPNPSVASSRPRIFAAVCQSIVRIAFALAMTATLALSPAFAQQVSTGTIRGKVLNASNAKYIENAIVTISGTNRETKTNSFGEYQFDNVPAGEVTLKANYTGEVEQTASVTAMSGVAVNQDFTFRETASTQRDKDGTIVLDPFVVSAERYKNAQAIAIAEQRNSVNIKNVVATDAFGDIPSGNVGELVKFMPGVQVDYGSFNNNGQGYADSDATGVSVRGFGPSDTAILIDGLPVASATPGDLSRQVALDQLSINNASRVELIKVATPDMPSNSMGGQINLITKTAFEQAKPSYSGRVFFNVNSLQPELKKSVGPVNKSTYKIQPGLEFTASYPFSKTFGVSLTASSTNQINQSYVSAPTWTTATTTYANSAGKVVSLENPVLSRSQVTDSSQLAKRVSGNVRLDWKPSASQLLRANFQYATFNAVEGQRRLDLRPLLAAGADWGSDFTIGTTGSNTISQTVTTRDRVGDTKTAQLAYSVKLGGWNIAASGSLSVSESEFKDTENGHFSESAFVFNPGQVILRNVAYGAPSEVSAVWRAGTPLAGQPKDYTDFNLWSFDGTTAKSGQALNKSTVGLYKLDVDRDLSFLPFIGSNSLSFKFGARRDVEKIEKSGLGVNYREILRPGAVYSISDVLDTHYVGQTPGFGLPAQGWGSNYKLFAIEQANDIFYLPDGPEATNTLFENYNSFANQQKSMTDTKDAYYAMLSGSFLRNRLSIVAGARQEVSSREGRGPSTDNAWNYAKTADGRIYKDSFYLSGVTFNGASVNRTNADGSITAITNFLSDSALLARLNSAGIKYPDHLYGPATGTGATLESRKLLLVTNRQIKARVTGDPSFSFNTKYQLTKKIDLKASVSRSFKQPTLESGNAGLLSGNNAFSITENTTIPADGTIGTIAVANPNLLPEVSLNYDLQVAYYTDSGGALSVSYYQKHITNQVETNSSYSDSELYQELLPALGLEPSAYQNFRLNTSYNGQGTQKLDGWEFEVRQDFGFLGNWGKRLSGFASYAFNSLGEPTAPVPYTFNSPNGTPITVTPTSTPTVTRRANKFGGLGLQYSGRKFTAQVRSTYRNENEVSRTALTGVYAGNFLRRYQPEATSVDVNLNYVLSKRYSLFLSGRDVLNGDREEVFKDDLGLYPTYAATASYREFGTTWSFGINGKW